MEVVVTTWNTVTTWNNVVTPWNISWRHGSCRDDMEPTVTTWNRSSRPWIDRDGMEAAILQPPLSPLSGLGSSSLQLIKYWITWLQPWPLCSMASTAYLPTNTTHLNIPPPPTPSPHRRLISSPVLPPSRSPRVPMRRGRLPQQHIHLPKPISRPLPIRMGALTSTAYPPPSPDRPLPIPTSTLSCAFYSCQSTLQVCRKERTRSAHQLAYGAQWQHSGAVWLQGCHPSRTSWCPHSGASRSGYRLSGACIWLRCPLRHMSTRHLGRDALRI